MAWVPKVKLYNSGATSLLYTFPIVQNHNAPNDEEIRMIKQENFRAQGAIYIPGGLVTWEFVMEFILTGDNYTQIASAINTLESTIDFNTPYLLRIDDSETTYFNQANSGYKVKRIKAFEYPDRQTDLMNEFQRVICRLDVNAW